MTTLWIALGVYLAIGAFSVWAAHKDLIADMWWAWLVVLIAWPVFWWKLFTA